MGPASFERKNSAFIYSLQTVRLIMMESASGETRGRISEGPALVLGGSMLLSFVLGSIHSFSILLPAMENTFGITRASASLTYSIALIALAFAVFLGPYAYSRISPAKYVLQTGFIAAAGCLVAGFGGSVLSAWIGYGLLFGFANGLGYGYALQLSAQAMPLRKGFAMGAVTAAYALGAVVFPVPLNRALEIGGWTAALSLLLFSVALISTVSSVMLAYSRIRYSTESGTRSSTARAPWPTVAVLWFAYGSAVTTGLMTIAHATGIAESAGANAQWIILAPVIIAGANMCGSLSCGMLLDRLHGRLILASLAILSSSALLAMALLPHVAITMLGLGVIGFTYGGTISVYPAFIANSFGTAGAVIYGQVFTAWAAAGLLGPSLAGLLYDHFQNYSVALIAAAIIAIFSLAVPRRLGA